MTAHDVERLEALQMRIEWHHDRGEMRDYFEINQQIHGAIVGFARNGVLKASHDALLARAERARFFALSADGRWDESVREHQANSGRVEGARCRAGRTIARVTMFAAPGTIVGRHAHAKRKADAVKILLLNPNTTAEVTDLLYAAGHRAASAGNGTGGGDRQARRALHRHPRRSADRRRDRAGNAGRGRLRL